MKANPAHDRIERAAHELAVRHPRLVLAVSGGADSMALLHAVRRMSTHDAHVVVATFDHGTGEHAREAVRVVRAAAAAAGFPFRTACAERPAATEAAWRAARWGFLRDVATTEGACVATAHTHDDHVETVVMRILRGAGARGVAGLYAASDAARPFLASTRAELRGYLNAHAVDFLDDPTNNDLRFFRNRVRLELLPALQRARPTFVSEIESLSAQAASLRHDVDAFVDQWPCRVSGGRLEVPAVRITSLSSRELAFLWPVLLARLGVAMDRRGVMRLAQESVAMRVGARLPLSGGAEVVRRRSDYLVRLAEDAGNPCRLEPRSTTVFGPWRISPVEATTIRAGSADHDPWWAALATGKEYHVRAWQPGDRIGTGQPGQLRRVARCFEDAGISGPERVGWPVVLDGNGVVWIPGIRRGRAATVRSGGPTVVYHCERNDS